MTSEEYGLVEIQVSIRRGLFAVYRQTSHRYGGDQVSTGIVRGCWRAGVVRVPVNKSGKPIIGEYNYAMAA